MQPKTIRSLCVLSAAVAAATLLLPARPASAAVPTVSTVGAVALPAGSTDAAELSGITYAGGSQFYTVGDGNAGLYPLSISIDPTTGAITSATLSPKVTLASGSDVEGVAYDASTNSVFISDETGPAIRQHNLTTGSTLSTVTVPSVFANIRPNLSLESLSRGAGAMWTANEQSLTVDGPTSTFGSSAGTWVRLQKFDASGAPAGQWAYKTDGIRADSPFTTAETSGVSDLVALPDGRLLVLERELGGSPIPDFRNQLYLVDFTGATDVSAIAALDSASFTGVTKTQIWQGFSFNNYEGITLGPQLANGDYSLILVSDNGDGVSAQNLQALRITGVPEPTGAAVAAFVGAIGLLRRRARQL